MTPSSAPPLLARLRVSVDLLNEQVLREAAPDLSLDCEQPLDKLLLAAAVEAELSLNGASLLDTRIGRMAASPGSRWQVEVDVTVNDLNALLAQAREAVLDIWQDDGLANNLVTAEDALFELLCASNSRPSPVTMGIAYC